MSNINRILLLYFRFLESLGGPRNTFIGLLCGAALFCLDVSLPNEYVFTFFYLLPIAFITWFSGKHQGLLASALITVLMTHHYTHYSYFAVVFNIVSTFGMFSIVTVLLFSIKKSLIAERTLAEKFQAIAHYAASWEAWFNHEGKLLWMNSYAERVTGYTTAEYLSEENCLALIIAEEDAALGSAIFREAAEGSSGDNVELRCLRKDGSQFWASMSWQPIFDVDGRSLGFRTSSQDITSRKKVEEALEESNRKLEAIATTDSLTGIANRRHFDEVLAKEHARHARSGLELSLVMFDVDHFKAFNDHYGHLSGDDCLRKVAGALAATAARAADVAARYGGEEFACILPETNHWGALSVAESLRQAIWQLAIPHKGSDAAGRVSVSLGVATLRCGTHSTPLDIVLEADRLLYKAKSLGRNRIAGSPPEALSQPCEVLQMVWKDEFCSGSELIDAQHRSLFVTANLLIQGIMQECPKEMILASVERLLEEITGHFRDEELLLESVSFPGFLEHAGDHAALMEKGSELVRKYEADVITAGDLLVFLVHEVIMQHLLTKDVVFFPFTSRPVTAQMIKAA